jgi:hypothetical protein
VPTTTRTVDTPAWPNAKKAPFALDAWSAGMVFVMAASGDPWAFAAMREFGGGAAGVAAPETTFDRRHEALKAFITSALGGLPADGDPSATGNARKDVIISAILQTFPTILKKWVDDCDRVADEARRKKQDPAAAIKEVCATTMSALDFLAFLLRPETQWECLRRADGGAGLIWLALGHPYLEGK